MVRILSVAVAIAAGLLAPPLLACSLCGSMNLTRATLRDDAGTAKMVIYGTLANPKIGADGRGTTDIRIESILKSDPILGDRKVLTLQRYIPVDPKSPPKFMVFCDVINGEIDAFRGLPVKSASFVEYLRQAAKLPNDRVQQLLFYFRYLDDPDVEIGTDAFIEFAKTSDADVARAAKKLDAGRLRKLLSDPATPPERLSLYAYLLGASGGPADAEFLAKLLSDPAERLRPAFGGILAGLIQLDPKSGWARTLSILRDPNRPFGERHATLGALRFFHGAHANEAKGEILQGLHAALAHGDLADLAIEDLRRWQWWDFTPDVLALYSRPTHSAPIMRRTIIRYALTCPRPEAKEFIARLRASDPGLVQDLEEGLQFEKPVTAK